VADACLQHTGLAGLLYTSVMLVYGQIAYSHRDPVIRNSSIHR